VSRPLACGKLFSSVPRASVPDRTYPISRIAQRYQWVNDVRHRRHNPLIQLGNPAGKRSRLRKPADELDHGATMVRHGKSKPTHGWGCHGRETMPGPGGRVD
jgi:hypothetical protein